MRKGSVVSELRARGIDPFWCVFLDPVRETQFRLFRLPANRSDLVVAMAVPVGVVLLFAISDFINFGWGSAFTGIMLFRLSYMAATLLLMGVMRKTSDPLAFDLLIVAWALFTDVFSISISLSRPPDYYQYLLMDILVLVFVYTIFPFRISFKVPTVLAMTLIEMWAVHVYKDPMSDGVAFATYSAFATVNVLGFLVARRMTISERLDFVRLQSEVALKEKNEAAVRELEVAMVRLRESDRMRAQVFNILGRDLNETFRSLLTLNEKRSKSPADLELLDRELNRTLRGSEELIGNLLVWSRLQTGTLELHSSVFNAAPEFENVLADLNEAIRQADLHIVQDIPASLPVAGDRDLLGVVFRNLVSNAVKYCRRGGTVAITGRREGVHVTLSIRDQGPGMPAAALQSLERGVLPERPAGDHPASTGLGLMLCRELVGLHRGQLVLSNLPAGGLQADVLLPLG